MQTLLAALPGGVLGDAKRPLFFLLLGFISTFVVVRVNTRLTRARGGAGTGAGSIVTPGGLHIHHSVFGIVAMVVAGILEFAVQPDSPWVEVIAIAFGSGAALTLDEFALILHLEDVYWSGEGRTSIDAVILGLTFMTLLMTGLLPAGLSEVGDYITLSRWAAVALILSSAAFVVVCYLKGKLFMGTVGIFVPPIALVGALRLAKPGSPWAHQQYAHNPARLDRARRRHDGFTGAGASASTLYGILIGGRPHLHLPHLHHRRGAPDPEPASGPAATRDDDAGPAAAGQ